MHCGEKVIGALLIESYRCTVGGKLEVQSGEKVIGALYGEYTQIKRIQREYFWSNCVILCACVSVKQSIWCIFMISYISDQYNE